MAKNRNHIYLFAGCGQHHGSMVCVECGEIIDPETQDHVVYQKHKNGDWGYRTIHRNCYHSQSGWESIERKIKKEKEVKFLRQRNPVVRKNDLLSELLEEYKSIISSAYCQVEGDWDLIKRIEKELESTNERY